MKEKSFPARLTFARHARRTLVGCRRGFTWEVGGGAAQQLELAGLGALHWLAVMGSRMEAKEAHLALSR